MNYSNALTLKSDRGSYSYIDDGGEQTVYENTGTNPRIVRGVWLDLTTMTQNGTIKVYYKIDGTNYRQLSIKGTEQSYAFTVADGIDGVYIPVNVAINSSFKVTYTEGADEGAARAIPYQVIRQS